MSYGCKVCDWTSRSNRNVTEKAQAAEHRRDTGHATRELEPVWNRPEFMKPGTFWGQFVEDINPFAGETVEKVMDDETKVHINALRALMALEFQTRVLLIIRLYAEGLLKEDA